MWCKMPIILNISRETPWKHPVTKLVTSNIITEQEQNTQNILLQNIVPKISSVVLRVYVLESEIQIYNLTSFWQYSDAIWCSNGNLSGFRETESV